MTRFGWFPLCTWTSLLLFVCINKYIVLSFAHRSIHQIPCIHRRTSTIFCVTKFKKGPKYDEGWVPTFLILLSSYQVVCDDVYEMPNRGQVKLKCDTYHTRKSSHEHQSERVPKWSFATSINCRAEVK